MKDVREKQITFLCVFVHMLCVTLAVKDKPFTSSIDRNIFRNLSVPYYEFLDDIFSVLSGNSLNVTSQCRNDTEKLLDFAQRGDTNALKFLDSVGKPSSGILQGGVFFLGYYSECVNTVLNTEDTTVKGKYCQVNLNFTDAATKDKQIPQPSWLILTQSQKLPTLGICLPSTCTDEDLNFAFNNDARNSLSTGKAEVSECYTNENGFTSDPTAISFLCVIFLWVLFCLFATALDYVSSDKIKPDGIANDAMHAKENGINISQNGSTEALCEEDKKNPKWKKIIQSCILAFSLRTNISKLLHVGQEAESIRCLHGLRFLSMALIIMGHTFALANLYLFIRNPGAVSNIPKGFFIQIFSNGTFAVDTFYFISGVLVAYVSLKAMMKTEGKFNILYFYFHRYIRLTPLMMIVIAFCAILLRYIGSGPNWLGSIIMFNGWCRKNWWINLIYLQNFIHTENMCLSQSWYLATDMQIYLILPLVLIPLYKKLSYGLAVIGMLLFATTLDTGLIIYLNNYPPVPYWNGALSQTVVNNYYRDVYIKPYCRIGPVLIGILVGRLFVHRTELNLKRISVFLLWVFFLALALTIIYIMWPIFKGEIPSAVESAIYGAVARPLWALFLGWLTIACFYGYAGFVNTLLSWPPLVPLSRLTYCAYLIHLVIMSIYYGDTETTVDFTPSFLAYMFLGHLCTSYSISFLMSPLFEAPFIALEKVILSSRRKK